VGARSGLPKAHGLQRLAPGARTRRHEWPQWQAQDLSKIFSTLEADGIDLMKKMLEYDPAKRLSVG
jgi:cyclin-dependent kinase